MYSIGQLSRLTGISTETIRYYERIDLLPRPNRAKNGYRQYSDTDVERLDFIRGSRSLDFTLAEIKEILSYRDRKESPCQYVMKVMERHIQEVKVTIKELTRLHDEIVALHSAGKTLPDDVQMKTCVCHLVVTGGT